MSSKILAIWNSKAGSAQAADSVHRTLDERTDVVLREASSYEQGVRLAASESAGMDLVIAAGGDGTINAVINGMMKQSHAPPLAILPVGTGNNLCRSLNIPLDPTEALRLIEEPVFRRIDLAKSNSNDNSLYFANVASGGNSERVIEQLTDEIKQAWGPWCYLRNAVPVILDLQGYELTLQLDDQPAVQYTMWNVMVANSHMAAAGLPIAPDAKIDDGLLDVIVVLDGTPLDTTRLAAQFFLGNYLEDERVVYRTARRVRLTATPQVGFLVDGEPMNRDTYHFEVIPKALAVVVPGSEVTNGT